MSYKHFLVALSGFMLLASSCGANHKTISPSEEPIVQVIEPAKPSALRDNSTTVNCYSGGRVIFSRTVFSEVEVTDAGLVIIKDKDSEKLFKIKGDCVVTSSL